MGLDGYFSKLNVVCLLGIANTYLATERTVLHPSKQNVTVRQDIFADIIFSRILRILTKPQKYHVREYDFNDYLLGKHRKIVSPNPRKYHVREMEFSAIRENILSYSMLLRKTMLSK